MTNLLNCTSAWEWAPFLFQKLHLYEMIRDSMSQKERSSLPPQLSEALIQAVLVEEITHQPPQGLCTAGVCAPALDSW